MKTSKEGIPKTASCAVRVSMDKLGRVFLSFLKEVACKSETQAPTRSFHSTTALDPGVRTFQTIYDADGVGIEWSEGDMKQYFVLCHQADEIQSRIAKKRATWSLRRTYHRKLRKIKDKIKECHNKLALFLCENKLLSRTHSSVPGIADGEASQPEIAIQDGPANVLLVALCF